MRADVMVAPDRLAGGDHDVFMAGDDEEAEEVVAGILREFGWRTEHIRDLGPLEAARGLEMWLPLWLRIFLSRGTACSTSRWSLTSTAGPYPPLQKVGYGPAAQFSVSGYSAS